MPRGSFYGRLTRAVEHDGTPDAWKKGLTERELSSLTNMHRVPLYVEHEDDDAKRVGHLTSARYNPADKWLYIEGHIDVDRRPDVYERVRNGELRALSVSFYGQNDPNSQHRIREASFVTSPENREAQVLHLHSKDAPSVRVTYAASSFADSSDSGLVMSSGKDDGGGAAPPAQTDAGQARQPTLSSTRRFAADNNLPPEVVGAVESLIHLGVHDAKDSNELARVIASTPEEARGLIAHIIAQVGEHHKRAEEAHSRLAMYDKEYADQTAGDVDALVKYAEERKIYSAPEFATVKKFLNDFGTKYDGKPLMRLLTELYKDAQAGRESARSTPASSTSVAPESCAAAANSAQPSMTPGPGLVPVIQHSSGARLAYVPAPGRVRQLAKVMHDGKTGIMYSSDNVDGLLAGNEYFDSAALRKLRECSRASRESDADPSPKDVNARDRERQRY